MAKKTGPLLPTTEELLREFGDRLRLARLRRQLSAKQVAERAGMTPMTLRSLEHGGSGVTIGAYLAVMQVLGIEKDLDLLGKADPIGRKLQDARLSAAQIRKELVALPDGVIRNVLRALPDAQLRKAFGASPEARIPKVAVATPKRRRETTDLEDTDHNAVEESRRRSENALDEVAINEDLNTRKGVEESRRRSEDALDWINEGGFASAEELAHLIFPFASGKKKGR